MTISKWYIDTSERCNLCKRKNSDPCNQNRNEKITPVNKLVKLHSVDIMTECQINAYQPIIDKNGT